MPGSFPGRNRPLPAWRHSVQERKEFLYSFFRALTLLTDSLKMAYNCGTGNFTGKGVFKLMFFRVMYEVSDI